MTNLSVLLTSRRARTLCCCALFLLGLVRWWPDVAADAKFPAHPESVRLARSWAATGSLADPFFAGKTGPSAHAAPIYPVMMGGVLKLFGDGYTGLFVLLLGAAGLLAAQAALMPVAAVSLGLPFEAGLIAGLAWIAAGIRPFAEHEANLAGALAILLTIALARWGQSPGSRHIPILAGILCALTMLTSPAAALVAAAWFLCPQAMPLWRRNRLGVLLFCLSVALLVAPWWIRNYLTFSRVILLRGNFGLELSVSNNGCAETGLTENLLSNCFQVRHPNTSAAEAARILHLGEAEYNRQQTREALSWIAANPLDFVSLTARRAVRFWVPSDLGNPLGELFHPPLTRERLWVYLMTLMSVFGLIRLWRTCRAGALFLSLWFVMFPLVYYIIQFAERYRRPILWITFLLASSEIWRLVNESRQGSSHKKRARPQPVRPLGASMTTVPASAGLDLRPPSPGSELTLRRPHPAQV